MVDMSRRDALMSLATVFTAAASGQVDFRRLADPQEDPLQRWRKLSQPLWRKRESGRDPERFARAPHPFLTIDLRGMSRGSITRQMAAIGPHEDGELAFFVENQGNGPSWTCYTEIYEGFWTPGQAWGHHLPSYTLRGKRAITLQAGEKREVLLPWRLDRLTNGVALMVVYDPVLDPRKEMITYDQARRIGSINWAEWRG
ncbi:MAG: hypothetical protein OEZ65_05670 [Gemmatimonadota bacterium]|nr:hypothetical protein [Gemmatimonadota bacterium]MDH5759059.1 hypothetical protein [Gemmatimonadota bacterium]